ncbi:hypothetical protein OAO87_00215 [bacterium]|nr:hypothetical protein [bacterium]
MRHFPALAGAQDCLHTVALLATRVGRRDARALSWVKIFLGDSKFGCTSQFILL